MAIKQRTSFIGYGIYVWLSLVLILLVSGLLYQVLRGPFSHLNHQNQWNNAVLWPLSFSGLVLLLYLVGFVRAVKILAGYFNEENDLQLCRGPLSEIAKGIQSLMTPAAPDPNTESESMAPVVPQAAPLTTFSIEAMLKGHPVPLLKRRLQAILGAIRQGAPLLTSDSESSEQRHFPGPERELRTMMDVVLNLGIAGTFLSFILTFVGAPSGDVTPHDLLIHIGPGLISGLTAIIANIALRLCHSNLLGRQDQLAAKVETLLANDFLPQLPRTLTSPGEQQANDMLTAIRLQTVEITKGGQEQKGAIELQAESVKAWITAQTASIDAMLTRMIHQPLLTLAQNTTELAQHAASLKRSSETWAGMSQKIQEAHILFLKEQHEVEKKHQEVRLKFLQDQKAADEVQRKWRLQFMQDQKTAEEGYQAARLQVLKDQKALENEHQKARLQFLEDQKAIEDAQAERLETLLDQHSEALDRFQETLEKQTAEHSRLLKAHLVRIQNQQRLMAEKLMQQATDAFGMQLEAQKEAGIALLAETLTQIGPAVQTHIANIDTEMKTVLGNLQEELPKAVGTGIKNALDSVVELTKEVQEQAGTLSAAVYDASQSAAQQASAYRGFAKQISDWNIQLDAILEDGQKLQREALDKWHKQADVNLSKIGTTFDQAANLTQSSTTRLSEEVENLVTQVKALDTTLSTVMAQTDSLQQPIQVLDASLTTIAPPLNQTAKALLDVKTAVENMVQALQGTEGQFQEYHTLSQQTQQAMQEVLQLVKDQSQQANTLLHTTGQVLDQAQQITQSPPRAPRHARWKGEGI